MSEAKRMTEHGKRGPVARPRKHDEALARLLSVRTTAGERAAYERAAEKAGLGLSDWVRALMREAADASPAPRKRAR